MSHHQRISGALRTVCQVLLSLAFMKYLALAISPVLCLGGLAWHALKNMVFFFAGMVHVFVNVFGVIWEDLVEKLRLVHIGLVL